ncbi:amidohydrolase family protein [Brachybacterium paraconglomeratum]|uniref:amidohydrolase family protein n=1 Tax=Brachybacterium paraconglomeratum TaxID=173362 RepID=UPI00248FD628|nr:amidohydrolase family protein [Brachybacterium paraconglomeratum]
MSEQSGVAEPEDHTSAEKSSKAKLTRRGLLGGAAGAAVATGVAATLWSQQPPRGPYNAAVEAFNASKPIRDAKTMILEPSWTLVYRNNDVEMVAGQSIVVQDGRIAEIVDGRVSGNDVRIDMTGQLLIPGMISGHTHGALGSPTRGTIESGRSYGPAAYLLEELSDEDIDAVTAYNLAEILRAGCTTQVEQSLNMSNAQSYVRVARNWGVRAYPSGMLPTFSKMFPTWRATDDQVLHDSAAGTLEEINIFRDWAVSIMGAEGDRIRPMIAPQGPETQTPETLDAALAVARELGTGIHTHLATIAGDAERMIRLWGKGPVPWIEDHGWYDVPLFGAHMSGWDAVNDAPFLAKKEKFTFVHCPSGAGAGAGSGGQPFIEALGSGINVAVGLDSHSNDLLENAKLAVLYGRLRYDLINKTSPVPVKRPTVWDLVKSVTLTPANGLGRNDLGRIEVGALADLTSIDISGFLVGAGAAGPEPLNNLLYANGTMVRNVMTQGVLQVSDGHLVVDDENGVIKKGGEVVSRIWAQLETDGFFTETAR